MLIETLKTLYHRDLLRLKAEIELYEQEDRLWHIEKGIANAAGNLCLHLIGNLNAYIGATLGQTGYVRQRPLEFSQKDIPKAELLAKIDATMKVVDTTLSALSEEALQQEYPMMVFDHKMSTEFFLIHLSTHLAYHLGQINYHQRLLNHPA